MDAPKCRLCGTKHWGKCPAFEASTPAVLRTLVPKIATAPIEARPVTKPPPLPVTKPRVTKPKGGEFNRTGAIKHKGGRPRLGAEPMTDAERARRYRARKRAAR